MPRRPGTAEAGPGAEGESLGPGDGVIAFPESRRVLLVAPQPFYEDRGTPIAVRQVLDALSHLGYQVDVLTYPLGQPVEIPGVRVYRSRNPFRIRQVPIGFSLRKLLLDACMVPALWWRLRRGEYLCVHAVEEAAFPAAFLARRRKVPVIYDMQSSLPEQMRRHRLFRFGPVYAWLRRCERWLLANADLVMSSTGLAHQVRGSVPSCRVGEWSFFSGLAAPAPEEVAALRERLGIPAGARIVVYTGTFEPYQGLDTLLDAMPAVTAAVPDAVLVLVGAEGNDCKLIERRAATLGLNGNLRLIERQPRERIPAFLGMADVLVSPRAYGGNLPLKIFDYLAAGRPIVATDIATHRAILDWDRAVMVRPEAATLAAGLAYLLTDPDAAGALAERAQAFARANLGRMAFISAVGGLYADACKG